MDEGLASAHADSTEHACVGEQALIPDACVGHQDGWWIQLIPRKPRGRETPRSTNWTNSYQDGKFGKIWKPILRPWSKPGSKHWQHESGER